MPKHYEIKVVLIDVAPLVWRRILVGDDMALMDVAAVIIGAMGWTATHMFAFEIDGRRYDIRFEDGLDLEDSLDMEGVIARDVFRPAWTRPSSTISATTGGMPWRCSTIGKR